MKFNNPDANVLLVSRLLACGCGNAKSESFDPEKDCIKCYVNLTRPVRRDCIHRLEMLPSIKSSCNCGMITVYGCGLHERCTTVRMVEDVRACSVCPDYRSVREFMDRESIHKQEKVSETL
jgi:hypothetical protein